MPVARLIAAAALVVLAGGLREFGIGGGAILCVPEREIDADVTPYTPAPKHIQAGSVAFAFVFPADDVRGSIPGFPIDSRLAGSLAFAEHVRSDSRLTCRTGGPMACDRTALIDGLLVHYVVEKRNVELVSELDHFIANKIGEWRDNCHSTDRL
ncbi:MAG: hypothetical protein JO128_23425 [Alphaproteobacteria bacterium]|nr:hypothetical protein [Alphaproteobacteria bacterium]